MNRYKGNLRIYYLRLAPVSIGEKLREKSMAKRGSKGEVTGKAAASAASKVLRNPGSSKAAKTAAASALTQRPGKK
ncbi:MAG: hypothetical protein J0H77_19040 [Alphaproteobacteria bacterium]|nr:hypothetical protein [Alphaproteobacteria bacterium]